MAPTSYSDLKLEALATDDGGLDVGDVSWGHDEQWFTSGGGSESEVSDVGMQDGNVGGGVGEIGDSGDWIRRKREKNITKGRKDIFVVSNSESALSSISFSLLSATKTKLGFLDLLYFSLLSPFQGFTFLTQTQGWF
ncbi:hypothetical protein VNO80_11116 [Phaseolus coccineus]|uniref:Uncharacterized protein n=1 Tax=Phaseolus coccineus TaxID=3886 RepID=A0AAN9NEM8_PHACN